jgi:Na+/H+ antiporter NhaC
VPQALDAPPLPSPLRFRGGLAGALAPLALFLGGVAWLALAGAPDERGFWPVLLAALTLGLLLARDRTRYCEAALAGMSRPIVAVMILAWMLSGVLGALLSAAGLVGSLSWLATALHLTGPLFVAASFVACALVATSTGTSFGTLLLAGPLLYPAGGALGASPPVLIGAILAGATFGDSISPLSDTTIASAGTQGADVGGVVRSRLKYVLPAGLCAVAASLLLALAAGPAVPASAAPAALSPRGLPLLLVPALVFFLLLRRRHLVESLLFGILAAALLSLALGLLHPRQLLSIDEAAFTAKGLIVEGMGRGLGATVFTLLLIALVETVQAAGLLEKVVAFASRPGASARATELWIAGAVSLAVLLTTHSIVSMLAVGEVARRGGEAAGLSPYRRANLLDMTVCTWPFLLPYCLPTILAAGTSAAGAPFGLPRVTPLQAGLYNTYSWALLLAVVLAITTGFGRGERRRA